MMTSTHKPNTTTMILSLLVVAATATMVQGAESTTMSNGLKVNLYGADEIAANPTICGIPLATPETSGVPFDEDQILAALAAMHGFDIDLEVDVFVLPAAPAVVNSSFAAGNNVYLAPGFGPIAPSTQAYIVTHEMGHVLTWAFMDDSSSRWNEYMDLRGLTYEANGSEAPHADRAREIVAEDFRFLFGGDLATCSGSIENHDLRIPSQVRGLEDLLKSFMSERPVSKVSQYVAKAFPNPCNPRTTISMELPSGVGGQARLSLYDIRGRLVNSIDGGMVTGANVMIDWNGNDSQGSGVASGRYLYVLQVGNVHAQGSLTLVR